MRKGIIPGNSKSIWKAVSIAKDINSSEIPSKMFRGPNDRNEINEDEVAECFASCFEAKISSLSTNIVIDPQVYNGTRKIKVTIIDNENIFSIM